MNNDPIHEEAGQWYFWDETWSERLGPFDTEEIARNKLKAYCERLNRENLESLTDPRST